MYASSLIKHVDDIKYRSYAVHGDSPKNSSTYISFMIYLFIYFHIYLFSQLFTHSFIHLLIYLFPHWFIHLLIYLFSHVFIYLLIYLFSHLFIYSIIYLFMYHSLAPLFIRLLYLFIYSFILFYWLVHLFVHIIYSFIPFVNMTVSILVLAAASKGENIQEWQILQYPEGSGSSQIRGSVNWLVFMTDTIFSAWYELNSGE
jgi:hypothetical protein